MGFTIEDGQGNGGSAGVTGDNRLKTSSISSTREHEINHHEGQAYSVGVSLTPTGAGDCFLYLKNDNDIDMVVSEMMIYSASDEFITFKLGDSGTPVGGNTLTPINRNAGSGNEADVTALSGVDITGLSGGAGVMSIFHKGGENSVRYAPISAFIVPKNKIITGYVTNGAIAINVGIGISFHVADE